MGIIRGDGRARDWGYMATVPVEDLPRYETMAKEIQETHNVALIEEFNDACERHDRRFITVTKTEDLVVNAGLTQCIAIILGEAAARWRYIGVGTGTTAAAVSNTFLASESASGRIDMASAGRGWMEAEGMKLFFGAIGSEQAASDTYTEMGVFTGSSGGAMLNREVFATLGIGHVSPTRASIFSCVIEFCPVV